MIHDLSSAGDLDELGRPHVAVVSVQESASAEVLTGERVVQAVAVLVAAYTLTFLILDALPGNAADAITGGQSTDMTPQQLEALKVSFGLNRPVYAQWWLHLSQLFQGNLGRSYISGELVSTELANNLPSSAALIGLALLIALALGGGLALWATYSRTGWLRGLLLSLPPLGVAVPTPR